MKQVKRNKQSAYKLDAFSFSQCNNVVCICLVNGGWPNKGNTVLWPATQASKMVLSGLFRGAAIGFINFFLNSVMSMTIFDIPHSVHTFNP